MTNVLIIMADELSTWGLGCYPKDTVRFPAAPVTPAIDRLAARGTRFTAAYTPSPICVPTRAAIATGRYLHEIGYWSSAEPYDGRVPSWGHHLQAAGIPVTSIGKLHYRSADDPTGFDRQINPLHVLNGVGWAQSLMRQPLGRFDKTHALAEDIGPGETSYTAYDRAVADAACAWLATAPDGPWCTFVSFVSPHFPLKAPDEHFRKYDPTAFESGPEPLPDHPILRQIGGFFDHDRYFSVQSRGIARAAYFGLCSFLDERVGRVLDALDRTGRTGDTLVVLTSDHGEMLGAKGFWTKSTMYDDAARVPLIAAGPGTGPAVRDDPVSLIDLAPTICRTLGVAADFPGYDLRSDPPPGRQVISEYHDGGCPVGMIMLRWAHWKYVHYAQGHPPQLFDLQRDPTETADLAAARPDVMAGARARLYTMLDPDEVDARAHADQARRIEQLGGRAALDALDSFDYTPIER